jgi:hypothetical protein
MTRNAHNMRSLAALISAPPIAIYLRDSEVVIYRRTRSLIYQCRYKLANGTWYGQQQAKPALNTPLPLPVTYVTKPGTDNGWI